MASPWISLSLILAVTISISSSASKRSECPHMAAVECCSDRDANPCDRMDVPEDQICCEDSCGNGRLLGRQPKYAFCWMNAIVRPGNCVKTNETCATKSCEKGKSCCIDACKNAVCETPHECPSRITRPPYQSCGIIGSGCGKKCPGRVCCLDGCGDGRCVDNVFE